jgi:hypothetical protein
MRLRSDMSTGKNPYTVLYRYSENDWWGPQKSSWKKTESFETPREVLKLVRLLDEPAVGIVIRHRRKLLYKGRSDRVPENLFPGVRVKSYSTSQRRKVEKWWEKNKNDIQGEWYKFDIVDTNPNSTEPKQNSSYSVRFEVAIFDRGCDRAGWQAFVCRVAKLPDGIQWNETEDVGRGIVPEEIRLQSEEADVWVRKLPTGELKIEWSIEYCD